MAQNERRGRTSGGDNDPEVPEADAAEQRASADGGDDDWMVAAAESATAEASEADVVEQAREAGTDDEDEHR